MTDKIKIYPYGKPDMVFPDDPEVPLYKKALCGDHFFGNIFYPIWRDVGCDCCSFFRGVVTGIFIANVLFAVGYVVGNML